MTPSWVAPTIAISLVVIAASFLVIGAVTLLIGLALRRQSAAVRARVAAAAADARTVAERFKHELEGFADLSVETRARLRGAIDTVDGRLKDLDALVEVLQEEAEETALDVASLLRTVRRTGGFFSTARKALKRRRRARD